jgi:hypothetical protein
VQLLQQHGRDWETIAHELGTKSAIQVRNYFVNGRRRGEFEEFDNSLGLSGTNPPATTSTFI